MEPPHSYHCIPVFLKNSVNLVVSDCWGEGFGTRTSVDQALLDHVNSVWITDLVAVLIFISHTTFFFWVSPPHGNVFNASNNGYNILRLNFCGSSVDTWIAMRDFQVVFSTHYISSLIPALPCAVVNLLNEYVEFEFLSNFTSRAHIRISSHASNQHSNNCVTFCYTKS